MDYIDDFRRRINQIKVKIERPGRSLVSFCEDINVYIYILLNYNY